MVMMKRKAEEDADRLTEKEGERGRERGRERKRERNKSDDFDPIRPSVRFHLSSANRTRVYISIDSFLTPASRATPIHSS